MVIESLLVQLICYFSWCARKSDLHRNTVLPGLHKNVISVPRLIEKCLSLKMLKHKCIIESKRPTVMAIPKSGSVYGAQCLVVVKNPPAP
jgi:hypothetical protein